MAVRPSWGVSLRLFDLDTGLVMGGHPLPHTIWLVKDVHDIHLTWLSPAGNSMVKFEDKYLHLPAKIWMILKDLQQPLQVRLGILSSLHVACPALNLVTCLLKMDQHMITTCHPTLEQLVFHVNQPTADFHEQQESHVDSLNAKQQMML